MHFVQKTDNNGRVSALLKAVPRM